MQYRVARHELIDSDGGNFLAEELPRLGKRADRLHAMIQGLKLRDPRETLATDLALNWLSARGRGVLSE